MGEEIKAEHKKFIDESDYETLLRKWRYSPIGNELFQGATGDYYSKIMFEKRDALPHADQVAASKAVGWGG